MMADLSTLVRQFNSCKPEMKELFRLSDISNNMSIALATDYLSQSIQVSLSLKAMVQAIADHPAEATPEQTSRMKYMDGRHSKRHEGCQHKLNDPVHFPRLRSPRNTTRGVRFSSAFSVPARTEDFGS